MGRQGHLSGVTLALEYKNNNYNNNDDDDNDDDDDNNMRFQTYPNSHGREFTL